VVSTKGDCPVSFRINHEQYHISSPIVLIPISLKRPFVAAVTTSALLANLPPIPHVTETEQERTPATIEKLGPVSQMPTEAETLTQLASSTRTLTKRSRCDSISSTAPASKRARIMRDDIQVPDLIMSNADEPSSGASYDMATPQVSLQSGSAQSPPNSLTDKATVKNQARESEASRSLAIEEVHIKSKPLERHDGLRNSAYSTPERSPPTYAPVNHAGMAALSNGVIDIVGLCTQPVGG
jgi:hypothetical protein